MLAMQFQERRHIRGKHAALANDTLHDSLEYANTQESSYQAQTSYN